MTTATKEQNAAALAGNHGFSLISNEKLLQLYTAMVKRRRLAELEQARLPQGKQINAAIGQEAAAVGVLLDLLPEDTVAAEPVRAAQLKLVLRAAQASKSAKNGKIAVAFSNGDSGPWRKALTQADLEQLPILFVCPANPLAEPLHQKSDVTGAFGFPDVIVDGNDVVAVYRVATEAITHARKGNGATLIECSFDHAEAGDPILKMERYLTGKGLFSEAMKRGVEVRIKRELDAAIKAGSKLLNS